MDNIKTDFVCPNCKHKQRIKINQVIDVKKQDDILNRELFEFVCKKCNEKIMLDYPFKYKGINLTIFYNPNNEKIDIKNLDDYRVCRKFDDVKEKILINEDGYNDIVIEFIKEFLVRQMEKEDSEKITELRYDGKREDGLIFYCFGIDKSVICPIEFYNGLINQCRLKKIKKDGIVNIKTYKKYIRL